MSIEFYEYFFNYIAIYFPETKVSKYGVVFAELFNKKTGNVIKGSDGTPRVELFQIVLQAGKVKILGIYKTIYKGVFVAF
ncbi:MAG: hypothetical protein AB1465_03370 [Patescibacteria group bacterium]